MARAAVGPLAADKGGGGGRGGRLRACEELVRLRRRAAVDAAAHRLQRRRVVQEARVARHELHLRACQLQHLAQVALAVGVRRVARHRRPTELRLRDPALDVLVPWPTAGSGAGARQPAPGALEGSNRLVEELQVE